MKPLTIEQLKSLEVGEWVWLVADKTKGYAQKLEHGMRSNKEEELILKTYYNFRRVLTYKIYGTKWLAYKNKEQAKAEEYKINFNEQGGWEVRKYISAHYQPLFTADTKEEAERRLAELKGE